MKVNFTVALDVSDEVTDAEFRKSVEDKRRYLEEDVRVRFHDTNLTVEASLP